MGTAKDNGTASAETIETLKSTYGDELETMTISGQQFIFTAPGLKDWERFVDGVDKEKSVRMRELCLVCVKYPIGADLDRAIAKKPASIVKLTGAISALAGMDTEAEAKKL